MTNDFLTGKTAFITGASGGIGSAIAETLAMEGVHLILHGNTNRASLARLAAELSERRKVRAETLFANLAEESEQKRLIDEIEKRNAANHFSSPDILILAAGTDLMSAPMKRLAFEERLSHIFQVDVAASIRLAKHFGLLMKNEKRGGFSARQVSQKSIVFFSWDGVEHGESGETAELYAAAKGAIQGFSRSFAKTVAPEVRVCCVAPGWIKTTWGNVAAPQIEARIAGESLAGRWGTAREIAETVRFLVSNSASFLNNQTIVLNGGR
ncbi:MAG: SDR family oxidoreductase [Planctomycetaceae bacterium]|jgi:3-oxoacyl-[acyl-carrier protein] reductase|nr:SDR family oxidoreductase [Planctomycetaceae bacterium]